MLSRLRGSSASRRETQQQQQEDEAERLPAARALARLYRQHVLPIERRYGFHAAHRAAELRDAEFDSPPTVLLLGAPAAGKTSLLRYLLGGPSSQQQQQLLQLQQGVLQPGSATTFVTIVQHGEAPGCVTPGHALVLEANSAFAGLAAFGSAAMSRVVRVQLPCPILESVTFVDTPGIPNDEIAAGQHGSTPLPGGYGGLLAWLCERADRVALVCDAPRPSVSERGALATALRSLRRHLHPHKLRVLLLRADELGEPGSLLRAHGALCWSLGRLLGRGHPQHQQQQQKTREGHQMTLVSPPRVYAAAFRDGPLRWDWNRDLLEVNERDFMNDLRSLPRLAPLRRLNDVIARARLARAHACIVSALHSQLPLFGRRAALTELVAQGGLAPVLEVAHQRWGLPVGDRPEMEPMQEWLMHCDMSFIRPMERRLLAAVDTLLQRDAPALLSRFRNEASSCTSSSSSRRHSRRPRPSLLLLPGGQALPASSLGPFAEDLGFASATSPTCGDDDGGDDDASSPAPWALSEEKALYEELFRSLSPVRGRVSGASARLVLLRSRLPACALRRVWRLSDVDADGMLDSDEFTVANHLVAAALRGRELPRELPPHLVPPSKRDRGRGHRAAAAAAAGAGELGDSGAPADCGVGQSERPAE
ncbi:LOW QUALITY PROTEIN: EH domain-containing protein 3-like [Lethenteron reissneri]|uniref:LOW QUALITY PROTEIN: EH domain-containing protein 3-like n=1 Tax=Lethenteron reissneri TaxID=7753 RepID=UPI002AB727B1|nr:LOW QUALITY PROTEIN: EH domain-containing protein 3-like [Lethenteron reissneri]